MDQESAREARPPGEGCPAWLRMALVGALDMMDEVFVDVETGPCQPLLMDVQHPVALEGRVERLCPPFTVTLAAAAAVFSSNHDMQ